MEIGNVSKRQQPGHRADTSRRPSMYSIQRSNCNVELITEYSQLGVA